jgi:hypothetical protein
MKLRYLTKSPNSDTYRCTALQYWDEEGEFWSDLPEVTCTDETYNESQQDKDWDCTDGLY